MTRATLQGSILRVQVDGETYGHGGFRSSGNTDYGKLLTDNYNAVIMLALGVSTISIALIMLFSSWRASYKDRRSRNKRLKEKFLDGKYEDSTEPDFDTQQRDIYVVENDGKSANVKKAAATSSQSVRPRVSSTSRGRSRKRTLDDNEKDIPALSSGSSLSDLSTATEPKGKGTPGTFADLLKQPIKNFTSVWKNGIEKALSGGGDADSSEDAYSSDEGGYDESWDSLSRASESTRTKNTFNNQRHTDTTHESSDANNGATQRSTTNGTGYVTPLDTAGYVFSNAPAERIRNHAGSAKVLADRHDGDATGSVGGSNCSSESDDIEQFFDELSEKILSKR